MHNAPAMPGHVGRSSDPTFRTRLSGPGVDLRQSHGERTIADA